MTTNNIERSIAIMKAHVAALGDRDHRDVSAAELYPSIAKAVPGVTHEEIITALQAKADIAIEEARNLLSRRAEAGRATDILNGVIHAPDRAALAIAYAQGYEAGSEGRGTQEDVPAIYRAPVERQHEGCAWYLGHILGAVAREFVEDVTDDWARRNIKAGKVVHLGNGQFVDCEHYKPEIHGPAVPYRRPKSSAPTRSP